MRRRGLTNAVVRAATGAAISTVRNWRSGRSAPAPLAARALEKAFGYPPPRLAPTSWLNGYLLDNRIESMTVAAALGVTPACVRMWRQGVRRPTQTHARALAVHLGVDLHLIRPDLKLIVEVRRQPRRRPTPAPTEAAPP